jgi:hypothetical protein
MPSSARVLEQTNTISAARAAQANRVMGILRGRWPDYRHNFRRAQPGMTRPEFASALAAAD